MYIRVKLPVRLMGGDVYSGGLITDFKNFNYSNISSNPTNWINTSTITKYSMNCQPIEEKDAFGIYSSIKYGYLDMFPKVEGRFADYNSLYYNSFEDRYWFGTGNNGVTTDFAHTGKKSLKLVKGTSTTVFNSNVSGEELRNSGAISRVWVKSSNEVNLTAIINNSSSGLTYTKLCSSGEWSLYELKIDKSLKLFTSEKLWFSLQYNSGDDDAIYIDDVRLHPAIAVTKAYVYDYSTSLLSAILDDQNFALYFTYDEKGQLISKRIETERGIYTIEDRDYNTYNENR